MQPVSEIKDLGESVMYFIGKTLEDAKQAAQEYARERGATAQRYFLQAPFGSKTVSIIADYTVTK